MHSQTKITFQITRARYFLERGYALLGILFALTALLLAMAAAAPSVAIAIRRAREEELIHRGQQYSIAIRRFYLKFGRYPANIEQLENTNNLRFLRRRYLDPLTGKDDWTMIHYGEAQPPLGFFGQKLTTASVISPGSAQAVPQSGNGGGAAPLTSSNPIANIDLTKGTGAAPPGSLPGSFSDKPGTPQRSDGTGADFSNSPANRRLGGAIVGVSVLVARQSLKEFHHKDHYSEWQFVYDPLVDPTHGVRAGASGPVGGLNLSGSNQRQVGEHP